MRNIIIALCFFIVSACASTGPHKMYSGAVLPESEIIDITIPAGILLDNIDGKGFVVGYVTRNKVLIDDFRDREISLLPGTHAIEFEFNVFTMAKAFNKEMHNIVFNGVAGRKYRMAFEAVSCSNDSLDMVVMIHEQQKDSGWQKLTGTDVNIKVTISNFESMLTYKEIDLNSIPDEQDSSGYVIFSRKAFPDKLGIVPFKSYNFAKRREVFTDYIIPGTGLSYKSLGLQFDSGKKISIFKLPAGKYLTTGFSASKATGGGTIMYPTLYSPGIISPVVTKVKNYPYCSKFEVLPNKYVYLGMVDYNLSEGAITVLDNSTQDIEEVKVHYPQLTSDQFLVDVLQSEK